MASILGKVRRLQSLRKVSNPVCRTHSSDSDQGLLGDFLHPSTHYRITLSEFFVPPSILSGFNGWKIVTNVSILSEDRHEMLVFPAIQRYRYVRALKNMIFVSILLSLILCFGMLHYHISDRERSTFGIVQFRSQFVRYIANSGNPAKYPHCIKNQVTKARLTIDSIRICMSSDWLRDKLKLEYILEAG